MNKTAKPPWVSRTPFFYGWVILCVAMLGMFGTGPAQSHLIGIFFDPISLELGLPRTSIAAAYGSATLMAALLLPQVGKLIDRWGPASLLWVLATGLGLMAMVFSMVSNWVLLAVAFGYALYQITTRMIAGQDDAVMSLFYTAFIGAGLVTVIVPFFWRNPVETEHWLMLAGLGAIGGLSHYMLIKAFEFAPVSVLAPVSYTSLPWNTLFGYWVFGDLPDRWTVTGACILIATGIYILYREGVRAGS